MLSVLRDLGFVAVGFDVYGSCVEMSNLVEEVVFNGVREVACVGDPESRLGADRELGTRAVAFPADTDVGD
jgi:hypothetical protein